MKTIRKKYLTIKSIFIIFIFLFCLTCTGTSKSGILSKQGDSDTLLNASWILRTLNGNEVVKEEAGNEIPYLTLNTKENSVLGSTGCNTINGNITVTGDVIKFTDMSMTKMFCSDADYEQDFVSALFHDGTVNFKIENGILTFIKQDKAVMSFEKK